VLCGGTELLLLFKLGFAAYGHLVDVKRIAELGGLRADDGSLAIGATATHREIERSALVRERLPALAAMERGVANLRVRNVGTLGGNLCFADPHSDPATLLLVLDAEVELRGKAGARRLPLSEFALGPYRTALGPAELLASVRVPLPAPGTGIAHRKLAFHERPAATVACAVRAAGGTIAEARIAVGSVGPRPVRADEAERLLAGKPAEADGLEEAAAAAAAAAGAVEDANGSVEYKENLVRVLVRRALAEAYEAAGT
jgi:carbon-monoxide dehydrogenase medium subunit